MCDACWRASASGVYDGPLRNIIHAFKYESRRSLAKPLASLMRDRHADVLAGADIVVPVPLHPSRRRNRGFNQADDLARHLGLPVVLALKRLRATGAQAKLSATDRHSNLDGAFTTTRQAKRLRGKVVVIVDDVTTTGSTLRACAAALQCCGALELRSITAGRTPLHYKFN